MKKFYPWIILAVAFLSIFYLIFRAPVLNYGGDIAEYHGITETIIKSGSLALTPTAEYNLKTYLPPVYFNNPGYYIIGVDGLRYPVHFFLYSLLAIPTRLVLHLFSINELQTLRLTNVIFLGITLFILFKYIVYNNFKRLILLGTLLLSHFVFFLSWPGPDAFYLLLLLTACLAFLKKHFITAGIITAVAALQSQPLSILALLIAGYALFMHIIHSKRGLSLKTHAETILKIGIIPFILVIPVVYNLLYFGVVSPWTQLQDGWTILNGFGLQNLSLQKLFEQFFDLNYGLFFYAPILILAGFYFLWKFKHNKDVVFLFLSFILTAFFYQTNPAWHYGTAGYGPSRHAIFLLPLFIVFFVFIIQKSRKHYALLAIFILVQVPILYMNGFVNPDITNTLKNSPTAMFVLDRWPYLYNPTPEIFVDRTNHTDLDVPSSAVYKTGNSCKKAYVLITDISAVEAECGKIPSADKDKFDDYFARKSNVYRTTKTTTATFWPDPQSCMINYKGPYICIHNSNEFTKQTGVVMSNRVKDLGNGVWKIETGAPLPVTVPPGYFIQYQSLTGYYINF